MQQIGCPHYEIRTFDSTKFIDCQKWLNSFAISSKMSIAFTAVNDSGVMTIIIVREAKIGE